MGSSDNVTSSSKICQYLKVTSPERLGLIHLKEERIIKDKVTFYFIIDCLTSLQRFNGLNYTNCEHDHLKLIMEKICSDSQSFI